MAGMWRSRRRELDMLLEYDDSTMVTNMNDEDNYKQESHSSSKMVNTITSKTTTNMNIQVNNDGRKLNSSAARSEREKNKLKKQRKLREEYEKTARKKQI